jgi:sec-independent protein translocase protein TatC
MIRRAFAAVWRLVTAPFRFIARPFLAVREVVTYEPEDTPATEAFARTLENPSLLLEHLEALRGHLLRSVAALVVTTAVSFAIATRILDFLAAPVGGIGVLQSIEVTESVSAFMRVSLLSGFVLAFPYICLEVFLFVAPGLKQRERLLVLTSIPAAFLLFVAGIAFAYYVMLPVALPFLMHFMGITTVPRPANYVRFVTGLLFWIGVSFQFPLIVYALASLGIIRAKLLTDGWRIAIVVIAFAAAAITPTTDPVNMGLLMAPMIGLYFISILLAKVAERGRKRRAAMEESQA